VINRKFSYYIVFLVFSFASQLPAQVTIDVIEFNGDIDVSVPSPNIGECDNTQGVFGIENEAFVIREKEGSQCCPFNNLTGNNLSIGTIGPYIFTEAYCDVTILLNTSANGSLEECVGIGACVSAFSGADEMEVQITLDGSTFPIGSYCGSNVSSVFSQTFDNVGIGTAVFFTVTGGTQDEDEEYRIESIEIEGTPKSLVPAEISSNGENNRFCESTDVLVLNAIPADGVDYDWVGPNGVLTSSSSSFAFPDPVTPEDAGLYTLTITESGGCTSTAEINIEVIGIAQKDVESRFPFITNTFCTDSDDQTLPIAASPDFTRTGTWNVNDPLEFSNLKDSTLLVFTYDDNATDPDSMYLRIDTLPSVGTNLVQMDICARSDDPFVNLVELFDLNLDNISTVLAFGSGRNRNELFNIDVSGIPPGGDVINFTAIPNGSCSEQSYIVPIMFELIEVGQSNVLSYCEEEAQLDFPDFISALGLSNNATGLWRDVNNSGIDLTSPSGVDISTLETGIYDYQYIVNEVSICGEQVNDTALLRLIIQPDLKLDIETQSLEITCDNLDLEVDLDFAFPTTNYLVTLAISDQDDNITILDPFESIEESHFINVSSTSGINRIEENTLFLNPFVSNTYTVNVVSYDASIESMCPIELPTGEIIITFDTQISIPIDTMICGGDVFEFKGTIYPDPLAEFPVVISDNLGCDTTFLLSVQFSPDLIFTIDTSICEGDVFSFKGTDYVFEEIDLPITVSELDAGCDTTYILNLEIEETIVLQDEVDPCIGEGVFRGITVTSDTLIVYNGIGSDCDTIYEIFYSPTVTEDSFFQDERCENDPVTINGVVYDLNNTSGSYDIITSEGCTQTVNVQIDFEAGVFIDIDEIFCEGQFLMVGDQRFDENNLDGEVIFPEASATGCDSVVFVSLEYIETEEYIHQVDLCAGQVMNLFGIEVNENTTMDESFSIGPNLCDTLLRFDVSLRSISVTSGSSPSCADDNNGELELIINEGSAPYTIDVEGDVSSSDSEMVVLDELAPGDYLIQVIDANGCELSELLTVETSLFNLDFNSSQNAQGGLNLEVISEQNINSVSWTPPGGLSCDDCTNTNANPDETTIYTVVAFNDIGCRQSISVEVIVNNNPTEGISYYLPTAFSPNNAGNDRFFLQSQAGLVVSYDMSIYSRYGEKMYEVIDAQPNDSDFGWDGKKSGTVIQPDVFVYHIVMRSIDGGTIVEAGDILLVN